MSVGKVHAVAELDLRFDNKPWAFERERRGEIDAHFDALQRANPRLFNGRVLVMSDWEITGDTLHGGFFETDYASFRSWLDWGSPPAGAYDCFGAATVIGSDGGVVFGQMASHTSNAGLIYFPCGTPDRNDIIGGKVDMLHNCTRELNEETGLDPADFAADPGWRVVELPSRLVTVKILRSKLDAESLRSRILSHLRSEALPELSAVHVLRGRADITAAVPPFASVFLYSLWP